MRAKRKVFAYLVSIGVLLMVSTGTVACTGENGPGPTDPGQATPVPSPTNGTEPTTPATKEPEPTVTVTQPEPTTPATTQPPAGPVEAEGENPPGLPLYPGAIRIDYITTCPCTPSVNTWWAAPDDADTVYEHYKQKLEEEGWQVSTEGAGMSMWISDGSDDIYLEIIDGSRWEDYPALINAGWLNWTWFETAG